MTGARHKNAWIWIAITAIALASVARVQSGYELARVYANPVIAFLSAERAMQPLSAQHSFSRQSGHGDHASGQRSFGPSFDLGLLPVLFIGFLCTLGLLSPRSSLSLGIAFPAPAPASLFQRPPPFQLL
jgi:hypothetical protein